MRITRTAPKATRAKSGKRYTTNDLREILKEMRPGTARTTMLTEDAKTVETFLDEVDAQAKA